VRWQRKRQSAGQAISHSIYLPTLFCSALFGPVERADVHLPFGYTNVSGLPESKGLPA